MTVRPGSDGSVRPSPGGGAIEEASFRVWAPQA